MGGGSQVGHVGLWLLGRFADRLRVGEVLSEAFGASGVVHDRGRVLVHLMLVLAGGGEACTDIETLRSQRRLFGEVASDSTLYRDPHRSGWGVGGEAGRRDGQGPGAGVG